jgi:hypothetical protein
MDPQQLNGDAMRSMFYPKSTHLSSVVLTSRILERIRSRVTAIIGSYGEILDLAMVRVLHVYP